MNRRNFLKRLVSGVVGAVVPLPHRQMGGFLRVGSDGSMYRFPANCLVYAGDLIPPPIPEIPAMTVAVLYKSQDGRRFFTDTIFDNIPIWREV